MRKFMIFLLSVVIFVVLAACGGENVQGTNEDDDVKTKDNAANVEPLGNYEIDEDLTDLHVVNEVVAETDYFRAIIIGARHVDIGVANEGENRAYLYFENKTEQDIYFEARDVFVDGVEMPDYEFYQVLRGLKDEEVLFRTFDYDGGLPKMDESLSFILEVSNEDTIERISEHEIDLQF